MSDLPPDLVEEILSRVPATALSRFRSTCKQWNALFKEQRFTKKHFDRAAKQFLAVVLTEFRVSSLRVNVHGIDNNNNNIAAPCIEFKGEFSLKDPFPSSLNSGQVDIFNVFHCDGLLLCSTKTGRLLVCNPCTGETRCIIRSKRSCKHSMFALGYENNKSGHDYKILRYSDNGVQNHRVEIYEFRSGSWRFLNVTAKFTIRTRGVSLKGNTYWIDENNSLLSFDFSTETLGCLRLPVQEYCYNTVLSIFKEEQLSVLHTNYESLEMEIWVTTNDKIDHTVFSSWRKNFAVNLCCLFSGNPYFSAFCVSFFIDEDKKVVVCCDNTIRKKLCVIGENGGDGEIRFGEAIQNSGKAIIFNYVPSLVQIQQATIKP